MKRKNIEFNPPSADLISCNSPWNVMTKSSYNDLILKPDYQGKKIKFPSGKTWFRVLPALPESKMNWMVGLHVLKHPDGRHVHPRSLTAGHKSVFDHAYAWCREHMPEALYSKINKEGYKLLADPVTIFWLLTEIEGKTVARLLVESGYDGSRGGAAGLGHQIWKLTRDVIEDGQSEMNPADPDHGVQICVEKIQTPGSRFPAYSVRSGQVASSIHGMLEQLDDDELAALVPLEDVVHLPSVDEEWTLLEKIIDPEIVEKIRESY